MDEALRARADARLEQALAAGPYQDPRALYRDHLRTLKGQDPAAFQRALRYFDEVLVPRVAGQEGDPLAEWLVYGRFLAELSGPGRIVAVDQTGRARTGEHTADGRNVLILHLPDDTHAPAFVLAFPRQPSPAQQATFDLLVTGKVMI